MKVLDIASERRLRSIERRLQVLEMLMSRIEAHIRIRLKEEAEARGPD